MCNLVHVPHRGTRQERICCHCVRELQPQRCYKTNDERLDSRTRDFPSSSFNPACRGTLGSSLRRARSRRSCRWPRQRESAGTNSLTVMSDKNLDPRIRTASGRPAKGAPTPAAEAHVWALPGEKPGTLEDIFAADDRRRQNLVLYEIRKVDGFRKCWEAIGAPGNPNDLIMAVMTCIIVHLRPLPRLADFRRGLLTVARRADETAKALEDLAKAVDEGGRVGWSYRLKAADFPDVTDPRVVADLRNIAISLYGVAARRAFRDQEGRSKMRAFEQLIRHLAGVFEHAKGRRPTITRDRHKPEGYGGRFWHFVEVVRPIATAIIETSGTGPLAQPATESARGKFIEDVLRKMRTEKSPSG
jgi:hypothetical protein